MHIYINMDYARVVSIISHYCRERLAAKKQNNLHSTSLESSIDAIFIEVYKRNCCIPAYDSNDKI